MPRRRRTIRFSRRTWSPLAGVERLEGRRLLAVSPVVFDDDREGTSGGCPVCGANGCVAHADNEGRVFMACRFDPAPVMGVAMPQPVAAITNLADTFKLHSLPTATKRIYLDFNGHLTSNTAWRGGMSFDTPAFSIDSDPLSFNDPEKEAIQNVWARVAEDFAPFDIDVTTEEPPVDDLINSGAGDTRWGIRVVLGGDGSWRPGAAGVAYLGSFNWNTDTPCFVFAGQSWKSNLNFMASCASHEVGHTLGLRHDGYNGQEYYAGRGTGVTSWGPLMGNPGAVSLTQWSKGEYGGSTNREDDLAIITGNNGFGYRADDHGGTMLTASAMSGASFRVDGIVASTSDVDWFSFQSTGTIRATVTPAAVGANLDILATLYNASGSVVAISNPVDGLAASFTETVKAGTYYIAVQGTGMGNVQTTGYTAYGSLGQYTVTVGAPAGGSPSLFIADASVVEGNSGTTTVEVTVTLTAASQAVVTVSYATADDMARIADADYLAATGVITFAPGELEKKIELKVRGDRFVERDETFFVRLSNASGADVADAEGVVTITNDDTPPPMVSITGVSVTEGNTGTTTAAFKVTLSAATKSAVTVQFATTDGTANTSDGDYTASSGTVTIPAGETEATILISVNGDSRLERDETFVVTLSRPTAATLGRKEAVGTIINDDGGAKVPEVSVDPSATVIEGSGGTRVARILARLSVASANVVSVGFTVAEGTATAGTDFLQPPGKTRIVFAPNQLSQWINVTIVGDRIMEPDETLSVLLVDPVNATLGSAVAGTLQIIDDDTPVVTITSSQVVVAAASARIMTFTVSLSRPADGPVAIDFSAVDGTAVNGTDFTLASGTLNFAAGEFRKTISVAIAPRKAGAYPRTFSLKLLNAVGAVFADRGSSVTATGRIS